MENYRLSEKADRDIDNIYEFGIKRFGIAQAQTYLHGLWDRLDEIAAQPEVWPYVEIQNEIIQRCVYKPNTIYYCQTASDVYIIRILGRQNIDTAFQGLI